MDTVWFYLKKTGSLATPFFVETHGRASLHDYRVIFIFLVIRCPRYSIV